MSKPPPPPPPQTSNAFRTHGMSSPLPPWMATQSQSHISQWFFLGPLYSIALLILLNFALSIMAVQRADNNAALLQRENVLALLPALSAESNMMLAASYNGVSDSPAVRTMLLTAMQTYYGNPALVVSVPIIVYSNGIGILWLRRNYAFQQPALLNSSPTPAVAPTCVDTAVASTCVQIYGHACIFSYNQNTCQ